MDNGDRLGIANFPLFDLLQAKHVSRVRQILEQFYADLLANRANVTGQTLGLIQQLGHQIISNQLDAARATHANLVTTSEVTFSLFH